MSDTVLQFPGNLAAVDTIADLRAISSFALRPREIIIVKGQSSFGDGSGGVYTWDASSIANDDGVSRVRPDDRTPLQAGRWVAVLSTPSEDTVSGIGLAEARVDLKTGAGALATIGSLWQLSEGRRVGGFLLRTGTPPAIDPDEAVFIVVGSNRYWERVRSGGLFHFDWFGPAANGAGGGLSAVTGTDDSARLQRAFDLMNALGGGILEMSDGVYAMRGPQRAGPNGATAQVLFPNRTQADGAATIGIRGSAPTTTYDSTIGGLSVQRTGVVLLSDTTTGPVLGGDGTIFAGLGYQTVVKAYLENITVRVPPATGASGVNLFNVSWAIVRNIRVDTGTRTQDTPEPLPFNSDTAKRSRGIVMPMPGNGNQSVLAGVNSVSGYYYAYQFGEHDVFENLVAFGSKWAALWIGNNYPTLGKYFTYQNCPNGFRFVGALQSSYLAIDCVSSERLDPSYQTDMPAWMAPQVDIEDMENRARGFARWYPTKGGTPGPHPGPNALVEQGAFYLDTTRLDKLHQRQASLMASGNLTVANDSETFLAFPVVGEDNLDAVTPVPNAQIVRLLKEGTYIATFQARFAANAGNGIRRLTVFKNLPGNSVKVAEVVETQSAGVAKPLSVTVETVAADPGVSLSAVVYQNSGGPLTVEQGTGMDASSITARLVRVA